MAKRAKVAPKELHMVTFPGYKYECDRLYQLSGELADCNSVSSPEGRDKQSHSYTNPFWEGVNREYRDQPERREGEGRPTIGRLLSRQGRE
jgi:hypothetical protein